MKKAVLSLSGGMDSSTLLLRLLREGYEVKIISFDYGQKHRVELQRATSLTNYLENKGVLQPGMHHIINLGLKDLLYSALVEGGKEVPEGHYENENMKETVVPNRNKIFSSIIQAVALSWAIETDCNDMDIAMGIHAGDHAIYPDCRQEFRDADYEAFLKGNWDSNRVAVYTPYLTLDKFGILQDGLESCKILGLDFDEVYRRTNTSYKPIYHKDRGCEQCPPKAYSDYKSASSVERIEAFIKLGRPDPVPYADEHGPVEWEVAKFHVEKLLERHGSK